MTNLERIKTYFQNVLAPLYKEISPQTPQFTDLSEEVFYAKNLIPSLKTSHFISSSQKNHIHLIIINSYSIKVTPI